MSVFAFFAAIALSVAFGWGLRAWLLDANDSPSARAVVVLCGGWVALHLWLGVLQLVQLRWSVPLLFAGAAISVLAGRRWRPTAAPPEPPFGWAEAVAGAAIAFFAVAAVRLWAVFPDFVFHWGVKGKRFALARGIDWAFLARPSNWPVHPDYPNLLPELYAVTALLGRGFREPAMMAWSPLFCALIVLAARDALGRSGVGPRPRRLATVFLALLLATVAISLSLAGSADWLIALAPLVAWPALTGQPSPRSDARLALAAALAAAGKIEGVPLAAFLVAVALGRRLLAERRIDVPAWARCAAFPAVVILTWWIGCRIHDLFQPFNTGTFAPERWRMMARPLAEMLVAGRWYGFLLLLLALPLLFVVREVRGPAALLLAQLGFYLYIYFSAPIDPAFSIYATFPRFGLHLLPTLVVAIVVASERLVRREESCDPSAP